MSASLVELLTEAATVLHGTPEREVYELVEKALVEAREMEVRERRAIDALGYVRGIIDQVTQAPAQEAAEPEVRENPHREYRCPEEGCTASLSMLEDASVDPISVREAIAGGAVAMGDGGVLICSEHIKALVPMSKDPLDVPVKGDETEVIFPNA